MLIPLGTNDWSSASENFSRFRLHNMYLADNPTTPEGVSRVSRPTLTEHTTIGDGPIFGIWRQDSTLGGDWFIVSGEELYRYNLETDTPTLIGDLPGTGFCQFAGTPDRVVIVRDGVAYSTDGAAVVVIVMPDDVPGHDPDPAAVSSVATINSYFILGVEDTQRFYWLEPGDVDPDPLNFASAERIPDSLKSIHVISDEIWFLGSSGPEVWSTTGDDAAPFQRINGRVYNDGCFSRNTSLTVVVGGLPAIIWVTDSKSVVMAQGQISKISNESVEESLKSATNLRAWFFRHNRHDFYILTCDEFTLCYDTVKQSWALWDSYLQNNWEAHLGLQTFSDAYAGSNISNKIWKLDEGTSDGGMPVIREVSGFVENYGKKIPCNNIYVKVNAGWSPTFDLEPFLELRWSDDHGVTWSNYMQASLGARGEYSALTQFRSLGHIPKPGRVFEFRFAEIARFRIDYATMNEEN